MLPSSKSKDTSLSRMQCGGRIRRECQGRNIMLREDKDCNLLTIKAEMVRSDESVETGRNGSQAYF